eukprot:6729655-Prymnesium_polylepis.1
MVELTKGLSKGIHGWWVELWVWPADSQPEARRFQPKGSGAGRVWSPNRTRGRVPEGRLWSPRAAGTGTFRFKPSCFRL